MSYAHKRIVFDTSSLIPACLNPDREPAEIFRRALLEHDVFCSADTFNELATVLKREKFNAWRPLEHRLLWVRIFRESVILVEATTSVTECRDPKDNKFLDLAISSKADVLVSSDVHLLEMHPFRGIQILRLTDFKPQIFEQNERENAWHQSCDAALKQFDETGLHATQDDVMAWMGTWGTDKELPAPVVKRSKKSP